MAWKASGKQLSVLAMEEAGPQACASGKSITAIGM